MQLTDQVRDVLQNKGSKVWSISPHASVFEAVQLMADKNIGALAVIDGASLEGIFSERDYARKIILQGKSSKHTLVSEVMTQPAFQVSPGATVDECMRTMTEHRIRHLFVVDYRSDQQDLLGVVSIGDLVHWIISAQAHTIGQLHSYISGAYPG